MSMSINVILPFGAIPTKVTKWIVKETKVQKHKTLTMKQIDSNFSKTT